MMAILDFLVRLYQGFRAASVEAGSNTGSASVISGFIVAGLLLGLLVWVAKAAHKSHAKARSPRAIQIGTVVFWFGCALGVYLFGMTFWLLGQPDMSWILVAPVAWAAVMYPALGRLVRYTLGR